MSHLNGETELDSLAEPVESAKMDEPVVAENASIGALHDVAFTDLDKKPDLIEKYMNAAQRGDLETLKDLLENEKLDVNSMLDDNVSALHWCAINNKLTALKYLVSKGAAVNHKGGDLNATPVQWACRYGLVYISDYLITQCGADTDVLDNQGFNCLHLAVHSSNVMMVIYILTFTNLHINSADPKGRTSLHWAAYQGDPFTVDVLLKLGADISIVDETGFTPFYWGLVHPIKNVLIKLIEAGSDINHKTVDNKAAWEIAADMNCTALLKTALKECDLNADGTKVHRYLTESQGRQIVFLNPYIAVPLSLLALTTGYLVVNVFSLAVIFFVQTFVLQYLLLPSFDRSPTALHRSPYFAGVFSATAFWCVVTWLFTIMPKTFSKAPLSNLLFFLVAGCVFASFFKAMLIDPGYIPAETNGDKIQQTIRELIDLRKFDSRHFCIHTSIRKPLRSRLNKLKNKNVAKFDHYCSWVNNDVGVRNHKLFFAFSVSLEIAIFLYYSLAKRYFDKLDVPDEFEESCFFLGEDMCSGYYASPFIFNLTMWSLFQSAWLSLLLLVQFLQISKGITSYEVSTLHQGVDNSFSSVPTDESVDLSSDEVALPGLRKLVCLPDIVVNSRCSRLIGLNQFLMISDDMIQQKSGPASFDQGIVQNWLDFLFLKTNGEPYSWRNLFKLPILGEANLGGELVDYYKLYKVPTKQSSAVV
ncbi:hypothetical protein OGAPHI_004008 [Ogataea philodendri]|uniref:Palmitoyltransferase n=1 Tax=Ogataea philodendri TaxID=1378263 RepID=A0A9P8P5Y1_9ASCO|nr:uncharacterized protein OGAPHI_004008 [Ogataea philodendri]KAH3665820.1 hypothetical protein OGAPHI_004008 [Ogataea philodendri]